MYCDDDTVEVDVLKCAECGQEFEVVSGQDPEECPICSTPFDGCGS